MKKAHIEANYERVLNFNLIQTDLKKIFLCSIVFT